MFQLGLGSERSFGMTFSEENCLCAGPGFPAGGRAPPRPAPSVRRRAAQLRSMAPRARGKPAETQATADSPTLPLCLGVWVTGGRSLTRRPRAPEGWRAERGVKSHGLSGLRRREPALPAAAAWGPSALASASGGGRSRRPPSRLGPGACALRVHESASCLRALAPFTRRGLGPSRGRPGAPGAGGSAHREL